MNPDLAMGLNALVVGGIAGVVVFLINLIVPSPCRCRKCRRKATSEKEAR